MGFLVRATVYMCVISLFVVSISFITCTDGDVCDFNWTWFPLWTDCMQLRRWIGHSGKSPCFRAT